MYRRWFLTAGVALVALSALLLVAQPASAQRFGRGGVGIGYGSGYYGGGYGSGWGWGRGNYGNYYGNNYYSPWNSGYYGSGYYGNNYYSPWNSGYSSGYYAPNQYGNSYYDSGYYSNNNYSPSDYDSNYSSFYPQSQSSGWSSNYPQGGGCGHQSGYWAGYPNSGNDGYSSFYPGGQQSQQVPEKAALVDVRLPADAQLWFSGEKTQATGDFRSFVTPDLDKNKNSFYTLKASWMQDGQKVERSRKVEVRPGQRVMVDFFRNTPERARQGTEEEAIPPRREPPADANEKTPPRTDKNPPREEKPSTDNKNNNNNTDKNKTTEPKP